jgi:hypothetical protein
LLSTCRSGCISIPDGRVRAASSCRGVVRGIRRQTEWDGVKDVLADKAPAPVREQLQKEAARMRQLAAKCDELATGGALPAHQRDELRRAALACWAAAAELEAAAHSEKD